MNPVNTFTSKKDVLRMSAVVSVHVTATIPRSTVVTYDVIKYYLVLLLYSPGHVRVPGLCSVISEGREVKQMRDEKYRRNVKQRRDEK